jgi:hypothetical protein
LIALDATEMLNSTHWLKALVPRMKMNRPVVREFVTFLKTRLQDTSLAAVGIL